MEESHDGNLTQFQEESYKIVWVINELPHYSLASRTFCTGMHKENVWCLKFVGLRSPTNSYHYNEYSLRLSLQDSEVLCLEVEVEILFLGVSSEKLNVVGKRCSIERGTETQLLSITSDELEDLCEHQTENGGQRIQCRIKHCEIEARSEALAPNPTEMHVCEHKMMKDLAYMMNNTKLSDIELTVQKQKFHAHKIVLASRSPVFMAMFENDMLECRSNTVDIPDISPDVMLKVLSYIYTDRVEKIEDYVEDLLPAAEKYQLDGLKSDCSKVMIQRLNEENALVSLIMADRYNIVDLKGQSLRFIANHVKNLQEMEGFEALTSSHWSLLKEILIAISDE